MPAARSLCNNSSYGPSRTPAITGTAPYATLEAAATVEEIYHVVLLGVTTLGFPHTVAALTWVEDDLKNHRRVEAKRKNH